MQSFFFVMSCLRQGIFFDHILRLILRFLNFTLMAFALQVYPTGILQAFSTTALKSLCYCRPSENQGLLGQSSTSVDEEMAEIPLSPRHCAWGGREDAHLARILEGSKGLRRRSLLLPPHQGNTLYKEVNT